MSLQPNLKAFYRVAKKSGILEKPGICEIKKKIKLQKKSQKNLEF